MAIPQFEMGKTPEDAKYKMLNLTAGGAGIDPNLLRLLAKRRQNQGLAGGGMTEPRQSAPQPSQGFQVKSAPIDPRLRAALMLRQKIKEQQKGQSAPRYSGPYGREGG